MSGDDFKKHDRMSDPQEWKLAGVLFGVGAAVILGLGWLFSYKEPPPPTLEELKSACQQARIGADNIYAQRARVQAELDYARVVASTDSPAVAADAQRAMEGEMGLASGEGQGWREAYSGRSAAAARELQEIGQVPDPEKSEACHAYREALRG